MFVLWHNGAESVWIIEIFSYNWNKKRLLWIKATEREKIYIKNK